MLILSRKVNENIVIDGRIIVKIVRLDGENVKLGIEAPADVPVHRQEVYDEILKSNREAVTKDRRPVPRITPRPRPAAVVPPAAAPVILPVTPAPGDSAPAGGSPQTQPS